MTSVTPATIAASSPAMSQFSSSLFTSVGYGRVTEGGYDRVDGYTGEHKSATFRGNRISDRELWVTGVDGGNCCGDSGGFVAAAAHELGHQPWVPISTRAFCWPTAWSWLT